MKTCRTLDIAGLRYRLRGNREIEAVEGHPLYQDFVNRSASKTVLLEVPVEISVGEPRPPKNSPLAFDSNETWLAFREGDDLVLAFRSPVDPDEWWWSARLRRDGSKVEVVCDPEIIEQRNGITRIVNPLRYPLDQLLAMLILAPRGGCIVHAAGLAVGGRGVAFVGRSGAGKTTLMRSIDNRPDHIRLSDDRVILQLGEAGARVYGTPWAGEGMVAANAGAELAAVVFLLHGTENALDPITATEAAEQLLPTTSIPWFDTGLMTGCLDTLDRIIGNTSCFNLRFRPDRDVTEIISALF